MVVSRLMTLEDQMLLAMAVVFDVGLVVAAVVYRRHIIRFVKAVLLVLK